VAQNPKKITGSFKGGSFKVKGNGGSIGVGGPALANEANANGGRGGCYNNLQCEEWNAGKAGDWSCVNGQCVCSGPDCDPTPTPTPSTPTRTPTPTPTPEPTPTPTTTYQNMFRNKQDMYKEYRIKSITHPLKRVGL
jgi:hypothetical protein